MRPALALVVEPPGIEPGYPRALVGAVRSILSAP